MAPLVFFSAILALALPLAASPVSSVSSNSSNTSTCTTPIVRKEWRRLSSCQKKSYIKAVQCLMNKPPITSVADVPNVKTRYDDFLATHIVQADECHFTAIFYPYHRWLLHNYELALADCGWTEGQPYWDWTLDAGSPYDFVNSPVFDAKTGFGGNGALVPGNFSNPDPDVLLISPLDLPDHSGGGCIDDGPFAGLSTYLGPFANVTGTSPYCVRRDFSYNALTTNSGAASVATQMASPNFGTWDYNTEFSIHPGGHWAIGGIYGTMSDKWSSVADPLFWLHHSNLDRAWWSWQTRDLEARVTDFSGPLIAFDYSNALGGNATLETEVYIGLTEKLSITVKDAMHIQQGPFCYTYDEIY
ncbi:uncharacterized protein JN550_008806 [Neoarthrinium moseri]|uniref:uncharacterized protein n=1 Tax=Neoarthrinium moseri TaxID=1658444 RepID=UPI001FDB70FC|nr:uncharacterized protein JN550_008806 [Neoarthrinium moseri]KAI1864519.1 hypothetical protein JN550_008806 [Neoarthrinium moseri]